MFQPQHAAIDVRLRQPHPVALLDVGFDSLAARLKLIEAAQRSIELEFFIYELDESARLITPSLLHICRCRRYPFCISRC